MAEYLQVTAPVAVIRDEAGAQHYFYEGSVLPAGLDGDHVKQLLDDGMLGEVKAVVEVEPADVRPAKVADVLKQVGSDKTLAQVALEEELARGEDARKSLVEKLQAVIAAE